MACREGPVSRNGAAVLAKSQSKARVSRGSTISSIQNVSADRKGERSFSKRSVIFANSAALSGHVEVQDYAVLGGFAGVHQFCRVGTHAFMGGSTVATKDVLPYSLTVGDRARLYGLNLVGLRRRGLAPETIGALRQAFRLLTATSLNTSEAVRRLEAEGPHTPEVATVLEFIRSSARGVVARPRRRGPGEGGEA